MTGRTNENFYKPFSSPAPLMVSTADMELVTGFPPDFTKPSFSTISFWCDQDCTVTVNDKYELEINKDFGLELDKTFETIYSLKIKQPDINFYFLARF